MTITATAPTTAPADHADRPHREQGILAYLLGRALDIVVVAGAVIGAMHVLNAASGGSLPGVESWQGTLILCLVLVAVTFLYGGLAGTVGTLGDAATGMRVVRISDGTRPGFRTGGTRALGWVLCVLFAAMLSDTVMPGDTGGIESRFVAVRRRPHTDQA